MAIETVYAQGSPTTHVLHAGPKTVHWGAFGADIPHVLTINPGDTVIVDTIAGNPADYEAGGVPPDKIPQALRDVYREVKKIGPGLHFPTGPIFINNAEPGDTLAVHIKDVKLIVPFAHNANRYGRGVLPEDFPYDSYRVLWMDMEKMTCEFLPGIVIPLRPFWGTLGVAPTPGMGRIDTAPPGTHGGNMDNKDLIAGTILYLPVHVKGVLFSVGDGHGAQGDGELNFAAIETHLKGTLQFFVLKKKRIRWPRAETPTHFMTMGFHEDLDVAVKIAVREMIAYLVEEKGLDPTEAYRLASVGGGNLHVTQVVCGVKGIHFMFPKNVFEKK